MNKNGVAPESSVDISEYVKRGIAYPNTPVTPCNNVYCGLSAAAASSLYVMQN